MLGRTFGLELPGSLAFDCPTAALVAEHIAALWGASHRPGPAQRPTNVLPKGADRLSRSVGCHREPYNALAMRASH
jgi:hypothetical protein